ncbi:MAG: CPBP family glutamic-type intramembrane protease [Nanoarchaeota archaeon]
MLNKDFIMKLLIFGLIGTSLFITIVPEYRNIGIIFFIVGALSWIFILIPKFKFFTGDDDIDRLLKFFFYPAFLFNLLLLIFNKDYRESGAGIIYMILSVLSMLIYLTPSFKNYLLGVNKKILNGFLIGTGAAFAFLFASKILPGFSLLTPQLPYAISVNIKAIVIIGFASVFETTLFRGAILTILQTTYNASFLIANLAQSGLFSLYHLAAYGVALGALTTLTQLYGATAAVSGALVAAFVFALLMGMLVRRYGLIIELTSHPEINAVLYYALLSVSGIFSFG